MDGILQEISVLPEVVEPEILRPFFLKVLEMEEGDSLTAMEALCELADKQWHSYRKLDADLAAAVEKWLAEHWSDESLEKVEGFTFIIAHLGLGHAHQRVVSRLAATLPREVRKEIEEYQREMSGLDVFNPYSGLERSLKTSPGIISP